MIGWCGYEMKWHYDVTGHLQPIFILILFISWLLNVCDIVFCVFFFFLSDDTYASVRGMTQI